MSKTPFVWEIQVRQEVLDAEIARLREIPYSVWLGVITRPMVKEALGRDNRTYRVQASARMARPGSRDIEVAIDLESPGLRRRRMRETFVITPDNRFVEG